MAAGISTYLANALLNHVRGVAYTPPAAIYAKIHTGNPGAEGTTNPSSQTTRIATTYAAAAAGKISMTNAPEATLTATETISYVSFWDAQTGGNFLWSSAATISKSGTAGDIIRIAANSLSLGPLAS